MKTLLLLFLLNASAIAGVKVTPNPDKTLTITDEAGQAFRSFQVTIGGVSKTSTIVNSGTLYTPPKEVGSHNLSISGTSFPVNYVHTVLPENYETFKNPHALNSFWNVQPINPKFDSYVIPKDKTGWFPSISAGGFSTGFFEAKATDKPMTVYAPKGSAGINDSLSERRIPSITIPRWPEATIPAALGDGHADIYDPVTGIVHTFWQLRKQADGTYTAAQWTPVEMKGTGWGTLAYYQMGARAAGVPTSAGIIRAHEINDGKPMYEHALAMSLAFSGLSPVAPGYVYPATSSDSGYQANYGKVPEGALLMIPADFDETKIRKDFMKKIVKTLKTYGARVVDRNDGTPFAMYVEIGGVWPGHANGWDNNYAADLDLIRSSLRMVTSQEAWLNKKGEKVSLPNNFDQDNLLSLRGAWQLQSDKTKTVLGVHDSVYRGISWGPTTIASTMAETNNINRASFKTGQKLKICVEAINGAKFRLEQKDGAYKTVGSINWLGDGQCADMDIVSSWFVRYVTSGVNVANSSVKIKVTRY